MGHQGPPPMRICGTVYHAMPYKNKEDRVACSRRHYLRNKETIKQRNAETSRQRRRRHAAYVAGVKSQPCMDCDQTYPAYMMDFDHRPGEEKVTNIANLVGKGASLERIKEEIDKCDLVCANCHRERTHGVRPDNN